MREPYSLHITYFGMYFITKSACPPHSAQKDFWELADRNPSEGFWYWEGGMRNYNRKD